MPTGVGGILPTKARGGLGRALAWEVLVCDTPCLAAEFPV